MKKAKYGLFGPFKSHKPPCEVLFASQFQKLSVKIHIVTSGVSRLNNPILIKIPYIQSDKVLFSKIVKGEALFRSRFCAHLSYLKRC